MTETDQFNERVPVGTPVLFWPGFRAGLGRESVTRSAAWKLGGHTAVVMVEGYAGGIALTHVMPRPPDPCGCGLPMVGHGNVSCGGAGDPSVPPASTPDEGQR